MKHTTDTAKTIKNSKFGIQKFVVRYSKATIDMVLYISIQLAQAKPYKPY